MQLHGIYCQNYRTRREKAICNSVHDTEALAGFGIRFHESSVSLCDALFKFLSAELYQSGFPRTPTETRKAYLFSAFTDIFFNVSIWWGSAFF